MPTSPYDYDNLVLEKFYLKAGVSSRKGDLLVQTGGTKIYGKYIEVDVYSEAYGKDKIIGVNRTPMNASQKNRMLGVNVKGVDLVFFSEAVEAFKGITGGASSFTELYSGDGTSLQKIQVSNMPISQMTSVTEDPSGTPTVLTEVSGVIPTTNQYTVDYDKGIITIGGTSVSGSDNYEIKYEIDTGRAAPYGTKVQEATVSVASDVGSLPELVESVDYVNATGTSGGVKTVKYSGTPSAGEVVVDIANKTLTFASADAITSADIVYKRGFGSCGFPLQDYSAGEWGEIFFDIQKTLL